MKKKLFALLLVMALLLPNMQVQDAAAASVQLDDELVRIKSYKLFSNSVFKNMDESVTDKVFYAAIKNYIKPYGEESQKRFDREVSSKLNDGNVLTYRDVFYLTFLTAFATDTNHLTQSYNAPYYYRFVDDRYWEQNKCNEVYKDQKNGYYYFYEPWGEKTRCGDRLDALSVFFALLQTSQVSGATLYDIKTNPDLTIISSNCPLDVAVRMLGRLYEASQPVKWKEKGVFKGVTKEAENRKNAILKSESDYPSGKKTYYVSTDGDDNNDGLSETTPWKSLEYASWNAEKGSVVLLKRGDCWWGESLACQSDITYSAYGTGPKPIICEDNEDANDPEKWVLCDDLSIDGKKIWRYSKELYDVGGIIFDDGKSYAVRKFGWWRDSKWVDIDDVSKKLTPSYALTEDLTFISLPDLAGLDYPILYNDKEFRTGPLYLRCDKGNPATIYKEIHFEQDCPDTHPILCFENTTVDNICVKYFGMAGITTGPSGDEVGGMSTRNITVSNCEVAFGGNVCLNFLSSEPDKFAYTTGDGIYGICNGATIKDNYIHDVDCIAIRSENFGDIDRNIDSPMLVEGNLCERNGAGIWLESLSGDITYKKITICDNIVMDNGYGWVHGGGCGFVGIATDILLEEKCKELVIKDNVVYNTPYAVYDVAGKNHKESGNRFYIGSYSGNTVIKNGLTYSINRNDKTATVIGLSKVGTAKVTIPKKIKNGKNSYTVTGIAPYAFYDENELKTITIKSTKLTGIGACSFKGLSRGVKIYMPNSCKNKYSKLLNNAGLRST